MGDEKKDNVYWWWILFGLNIIVYGLCCIMIIKRKNYTSISIRSPTLLLSTNFSNFLIITIITFYEIFEINLISSFYYIFRLTMVLSIILRYERILACCRVDKVKRDEIELDKRQFTEKKYLYQEKFYVRILICAFTIFLIVMIIINIVERIGINFFYTFNYIFNFNGLEEKKKKSIFKSQMLCFIIWNFIEQFVLITYLFRIFTKAIKEKIKTELLLYFILWLIYSFICTFIDYYTGIEITKIINDKKKYNLKIIIILISICFLYISLFINGYFPIILTYYYKTAISYHFSPKLMNNLYLFLTYEECYNALSDYLIKINNTKGIFFLKLYTHIMTYKLSFVLNAHKDNNNGLNDAIEIYNAYFAKNNINESQIDGGILQKVRSQCQILESNTFNQEMFDDALQFIFTELNKLFLQFQNTKEFHELYMKIKLESYIHCKMCNTGLINKY